MNILITGTSSGLGFGLAKYYLENDHSVYGISRHQNDQLKQYQHFRFLSQDISNFTEVETNLLSFLRDISTLDLVILNAGILPQIKDLRETKIEEIQRVMDVNVWANKILIDSLFHQADKIKQIVAISSGAAVSGSRGWNAYALSKATLNMLINLYSKENGKTHFCALAPGLIDSGMQAYISSLPEERQYPTIQRLKKAREANEMPSPMEAAEINARAIEKVIDYPSGSFLDVRDLL